MIHLTEDIEYNELLPFEEQEQNVKEYINEQFFAKAILEPTVELRNKVITGTVGEADLTVEGTDTVTVFDKFCRPVYSTVTLPLITIKYEIFYQCANTSWAIERTVITVTIN